MVMSKIKENIIWGGVEEDLHLTNNLKTKQTSKQNKIPIKIIDAGYTMSTYLLSLERENILFSQGISRERIQYIKKMSNKSHWPQGLSNTDTLLANVKNIKNYQAYLEAKFKEESFSYTTYVVSIPVEPNQSMSKKLRPKKEFFMIIQGHGVEELDALSFIPVFIKDTGKIMSTFVITKQIEKTLLSHGLTKERIQIIKKMSQESNWPDRMALLQPLQKRNVSFTNCPTSLSISRVK